MACRAPRQRWHPPQSGQCGIYNLQNPPRFRCSFHLGHTQKQAQFRHVGSDQVRTNWHSAVKVKSGTSFLREWNSSDLLVDHRYAPKIHPSSCVHSITASLDKPTGLSKSAPSSPLTSSSAKWRASVSTCTSSRTRPRAARRFTILGQISQCKTEGRRTPTRSELKPVSNSQTRLISA